MVREQWLLDLFYPVDIVGSTTTVQVSGVDTSTGQIQVGPPSTSSIIVFSPLPEQDSTVLQFGSTASGSVDLLEYEGIDNSGNIIASDPEEAVGSTFLLQVISGGFGFSEVSSYAFLQGVIGTSGTIERFFDTSPFYYTEHETDPNTERDIREAEEFLLFSSVDISTYPITGRIPASTTIIVPTVSSAGSDFLTNKTTSFAFINTAPPSLDQVIGANGIIIGPGGTVTGTTTTLTGPISISGSVTIEGEDAFPPYFDETQPASGTRFNSPDDLSLEFHIKDDGEGLDPAVMEVWIDGLQVITAGVTVTGLGTWPVISKNIISDQDYQYIFTRGFPYEQQTTVVVSGQLLDDATNSTTTQYDFTILGSGSLGATLTGSPDGDPPVITPVNPVDLQTSVSPDTSLIWTLVDNAAGVDPAATRLYINGVLRLANDVAIDGSFSRVGTSQTGFTYTYNPDEQFTFGSTITGSIQATDLATSPNTDSLDYEFVVAPTDSLQITNFFLVDGESTLLTSGTAIEVDVIDTLYGVDVPDTYLTINGTVPAGLSTSVITSGIRFSVPAEPIIDFREDLEVFVHAENLFPGDFPQVEEETFRLLPGYDVRWANRILDEYEVIFPYLSRIDVLADIKNFANRFAASSEYYFFLIENRAFSDMGAVIESNIKVADMPAALNVLNTFYEYGKTIVLEIEVDDLEGNQLRFTHTYVIEERP
jgi:hypothetical protein